MQNSTETFFSGSDEFKPIDYQPAHSLRNLFGKRSASSLNNRYQLGKRLCSADQGVLHQARDLHLDRDCCVKTLNAAVKDQQALEQQFAQEAEVLSQLHHPNIAALYEVERDEQGNPFHVMESLTGYSLRRLLAKTSIIPLERALEIVRSVGAALQHAHSHGIVHLDLNPSCIFLDQTPTSTAKEVTKVLHFGMAWQLTAERHHDARRNLHLGLVFESPTYQAPEALELSSDAVDERADQWSLAVLAYQMLSGRLPFWTNEPWSLRALIRGATDPVPLAELNPRLPPAVVSAITKAMSKDKRQRFDSMQDFLRALDGVTDSRPTKPEQRIDLIERCRAGRSQPAVAPIALSAPTKTREYPALSFPAELLASADRELVRLPEPSLMPQRTDAAVTRHRSSAARPIWPMLCILMAVTPAAAVLHFLQPEARVSAFIHRLPTQSAQEQKPQDPIAVAPPQVEPPQTLSSLGAQHDAAPKHQTARTYKSRTRVPTKSAPERLHRDALRRVNSKSPAQVILAEGLGL